MSAEGWTNDGHVVRVAIDHDTLVCNIECPGQEKCEADAPCRECIQEDGWCVKQSEDTGTCTCDHCDQTCIEPEWYCNLLEWLEAEGYTVERHDGSRQQISDGDAIEWRFENPDDPKWRVVSEPKESAS